MLIVIAELNYELRTKVQTDPLPPSMACFPNHVHISLCFTHTSFKTQMSNRRVRTCKHPLLHPICKYWSGFFKLFNIVLINVVFISCFSQMVTRACSNAVRFCVTNLFASEVNIGEEHTVTQCNQAFSTLCPFFQSSTSLELKRSTITRWEP